MPISTRCSNNLSIGDWCRNCTIMCTSTDSYTEETWEDYYPNGPKFVRSCVKCNTTLVNYKFYSALMKGIEKRKDKKRQSFWRTG